MIFYPQGCEDLIDHICSPCPEAESGRIRHIAFVSTSFTFSDITNPIDWANGIMNGKIIVLPNVNGIYDGGSPVFAASAGDLPQRLVKRNFKINFTDPNFFSNCNFYNFIFKSPNYRLAWVGETVIQISDKAVNIAPKEPIGEAIESERYWEVECTWSQFNTPCHYSIPAGIFMCGIDIPITNIKLRDDYSKKLRDDGSLKIRNA